MSSFSLRKKVYSFLLFVALVSVAAYFGVPHFLTETSVEANSDTETESSEEADGAIPVELADATLGNISSFLTATANLRALREVKVVSQTEGLVQKVSGEEGDFVKEGQVLCFLDDSELQIRLQSAKQKLAQANLQLEKARIRREKAETQIKNTQEDLDRYESLFREKLVSEREVAQIRYRAEELAHDEKVSSHEARELGHRVDELQAEISQVDLELARTSVRAPFSGIITARTVERGKTVTKLDPLFELSSLSSLYADVHLSEKETQLVRKGQAASVSLGVDDLRQTIGKVLRISPIVDQATGTVKITVELAGTKNTFRPGAFVRVDIETDSRQDSILVPKRALVEEDGAYYVFVAEDGAVKRVAVQLGYEHNGSAEILSGLESGQRIVVAGQGALKDGSKIKVIQDQEAA
jgi:membrane fusion protein (multidrug efflux system)